MNNDLEGEEMDYIMDYNKYKIYNYPQGTGRHICSKYGKENTL